MHGLMLGASRVFVRKPHTAFEGSIAVHIRTFARLSASCETSFGPHVAEDRDHGSTWHPSTHHVRSARTRVVLTIRSCRPTWPCRPRDLPVGILSDVEGNDRVRTSLSLPSSASLSNRSFSGVERGAFWTARSDCGVGNAWHPPGESPTQPVVSRLFSVNVGCSTNTFSELTNPIQPLEATRIVGGSISFEGRTRDRPKRIGRASCERTPRGRDPHPPFRRPFASPRFEPSNLDRIGFLGPVRTPPPSFPSSRRGTALLLPSSSTTIGLSQVRAPGGKFLGPQRTPSPPSMDGLEESDRHFWRIFAEDTRTCASCFRAETKPNRIRRHT